MYAWMIAQIVRALAAWKAFAGIAIGYCTQKFKTLNPEISPTVDDVLTLGSITNQRRNHAQREGMNEENIALSRSRPCPLDQGVPLPKCRVVDQPVLSKFK